MRSVAYLLAVVFPAAVATAQPISQQDATRGHAPLIEMTGHELYCANATLQSCLEMRFVSSSLSIATDRTGSSTVSYRGVPASAGGTSTRAASRAGSRLLDRHMWRGLDFALTFVDLDSESGHCNPLPSSPVAAPPSVLRFSIIDWESRFPPHVVEVGSEYEEICPLALQYLFGLLQEFSTTIAQAPRVVEPL